MASSKVFFESVVPHILYKYRDWSNVNHQKILKHNKIWLSSPKELNDPFDCQIPLVIDEEEIESQAFFNFLQNDAKNYESAKAKWNEILLNPQGFFKEHEQELLDMYIDFGVFSLCESPKNYLLWSHYANGHRGFCIGFNIESLVQSIYGTFEKVKYKKKFPKFKFLEDSGTNFSKALATKHRKWKYEQEWRITKTYSAEKELLIGGNSFAEVYFGARMDKIHKDEIIKIVKEKGLSIKSYDMVLSSSSFKVEPYMIYPDEL